MTAEEGTLRASAPVRDESDVPVIRDHVRRLGHAQGLSHTEIEALATAVSEITRNVLDHAGSGQATLVACFEGTRRGVVVLLHDTGRGIPDLSLALRDGYSTRGGLGLGLAAAQRMVDEFSIRSEPTGTLVTLKQWAREPG